MIEVPGDAVRWRGKDDVVHWLDFDFTKVVHGARCRRVPLHHIGLQIAVLDTDAPVTCMTCLEEGPSPRFLYLEKQP